MTPDHSALIERLEAAEAGDGDLSLDVNIALEGGVALPRVANYTMEPYWAIRRPSANHLGGFENGPNWPVTTSLDAALALAERVLIEPYPWVGKNRGSPLVAAWSCELVMGDDFRAPAIETDAATPALALCIAILKAKAQGEGNG